MSDPFGVVVHDLGGGDYAIHMVDQERWEQICSPREGTSSDEETEIVGWLTSDELPETEPPTGAPDRKGRLLETVYAQSRIYKALLLVMSRQRGKLLGFLFI